MGGGRMEDEKTEYLSTNFKNWRTRPMWSA